MLIYTFSLHSQWMISSDLIRLQIFFWAYVLKLHFDAMVLYHMELYIWFFLWGLILYCIELFCLKDLYDFTICLCFMLSYEHLILFPFRRNKLLKGWFNYVFVVGYIANLQKLSLMLATIHTAFFCLLHIWIYMPYLNLSIEFVLSDCGIFTFWVDL